MGNLLGRLHRRFTGSFRGLSCPYYCADRWHATIGAPREVLLNLFSGSVMPRESHIALSPQLSSASIFGAMFVSLRDFMVRL